MQVSSASSSISAYSSTTPSSQRPLSARGTSASAAGARRVGSGRAPQLRGVQRLLVLAFTAKMGFREITAADLPDKAREELARKVKDRDAISYWQHPGTGEIRVVVQSEDDREKLNLYSWRNGTWATLM